MPSLSLNPGNRTAHGPRVSVIVPTYERRDLVLGAVRALARQAFDHPLEVVVVVDGTAEALQRTTWPLPLRVIEQANQGAARARNRAQLKRPAKFSCFSTTT